MALEIKIVRTIYAIDEQEWDSCGADIPFTSLRWTQLAMAMKPDFDPWFILVYDGSRLVGKLVAARTRDHGISLASTLQRSLVDGILEHYPILFCQSPPSELTRASGLILPKGREAEAVAAITEALYTVARTQPISFIALGWMGEDENQALSQSKDYLVQSFNNMVLTNKWRTFDEYISSLGKSARKDFRQHRNHAERMGIQIEYSHRFAAYHEKIERLATNVDSHYNNTVVTRYGFSFYDAIERKLPENSVMIFAKVGDEIVGCGLLIHDGDTLVPAVLGKDYRYGYVYFQIFYAMLRYAIENNMRTIKGGVGGAYDFKRRLGFCETPSYTAFTSHIRAFRWLGSQMVRGIRDSAENLAEPAERIAV